jgi:SpoVK/Ycf46/Vps4 family AAA+-type ATPase
VGLEQVLALAAQEFVRYLSGKKLVDHIIVRGPAVKQFNKTSEAISGLKAILRFAENSYKKHKWPVVIVFDEAETLFADRGQPEFSTEATRDLVTTITSEISAAVNKHVMFILSTNFPQRIDQALLNRIDESNRIRFEAPGQKEREDLLRLYLDEALTQEGFTVSDEVMDAIPALAKSIDGMVGRQISSMVTQSIYRLLNEGEAELTLPIFQETIAATRARKDYAAY